MGRGSRVHKTRSTAPISICELTIAKGGCRKYAKFYGRLGPRGAPHVHPWPGGGPIPQARGGMVTIRFPRSTAESDPRGIADGITSDNAST
jgi:hypothetical protein